MQGSRYGTEPAAEDMPTFMSDLCSHLCMITFWGGATNAAYDGILGFGL